MKYKSFAEWPAGTAPFCQDVTEDVHGTREQAQGVCDLLIRNGFGGDGKVFPLRAWVDSVDEYDILLQDECNTPNTPWWAFMVTNTGYAVPQRFSSERSAKEWCEQRGVIREIRRKPTVV